MDSIGIEPSIQILGLIQGFSLGSLAALIAMILLLGCSALISGSEVAFFSLSPAQLNELQGNPSSSANRILKLLTRPKRLLATILISNNLINVAIIILSTYVADACFDFSTYPAYVAFIVQVVAVTFLILLLGEVLPKVYANSYALNLSRLMSIPLQFLGNLFAPLSKILVSSTSILDKRIKQKGVNISVDDLGHALELTTDEKANREEHKILQGIIKFGNIDVKQIMTARTNVTAFPEDCAYETLIAGIIDSGFSRIPIYKESFDNVVGILYIKDLLPHLDKKNFKWQSLIREPFFVPENKKIDDLLKEFQGKKIHLALVVDEYGGTSGIITLEDIIEEIVGEITDEFDSEDLIYSKLDEQNYIFEGKIQLNDLYRILDIDGEDFEQVKGEADTLAGFILEQAGRIPKKNESIPFEQFRFTIESADKRKIKRIKLTIEEQPTNPAKEQEQSNES